MAVRPWLLTPTLAILHLPASALHVSSSLQVPFLQVDPSVLWPTDLHQGHLYSCDCRTILWNLVGPQQFLLPQHPSTAHSPQGKAGLSESLSIHGRLLKSPVVCRPSVGDFSCCGLMNSVPHSENSEVFFQPFSLSFGSYNLFLSHLSWIFPESE